MRLNLIPELLSVVKLDPSSAIPSWILESRFFSLTRSADELSIFCETRVMPELIGCVPGFRALRVAGQLDLQLPGVISQLTLPLASRQISIFSISTHDTDYLIVHEDRLDDAIYVLQRAGHEIVME